MARKIFVVDDERLIADTLVAILQNSGYDATAFYDAESALYGCERTVPDTVISDVMMPGMNGIELAMILRERCPDCSILMFSGNASTVDLMENARCAGCDFELLLKPVHPRDLLDKLSRQHSYRSSPLMNGPSLNSQSL